MSDYPLISMPGDDGMSIKRIPMGDDFMRLECLRLAVAMKPPTHSVERIAGSYESYVRYGRLKDANDYVTIGSECFIGEEGTIISFKGENFYKACGNFVSKLPDGGSSHCVKRVGHPSSECEDYEGRIWTQPGVDL